MALNILQQDTTIKDNIRGKRLRAGWDHLALDAIFAGFKPFERAIALTHRGVQA